jgi:predicted DNA-binding protein
MKKTKLSSFTLKLHTVERLNKIAKEQSLSKSAFVDRLINKEIDKVESNK